MNREVFMDYMRVNIGESVTKIYMSLHVKIKIKRLERNFQLLGAEPFS